MTKLKSDLRNAKVGDWILTLMYGWTKIVFINKNIEYSVMTERLSFTLDGKYFISNKYPTAFVNPPAELIAIYGPKPIEMERMN